MANKKNYVTNKEFLEELKRCQDENRISERLGEIFLMLAQKFSNHPSYNRYTYKDEMISHAVVSCCAAFKKFDASSNYNPFAYFTTCVYRAFLQVLNKERKHQEIRDEMLLENDLDPSNSYTERHTNNMDGFHIEDEESHEDVDMGSSDDV